MLDEDIRKRKVYAAAPSTWYKFVAILLVAPCFSLILIYGEGWHPGIVAIYLFPAISFIALAFLIKRKSRWIIERALRASPPPGKDIERMRSCTEEVSLASGLQPPALRYIDDPAVGAHAMRWKKDGVIFISRGLLDHLSNEELRAVVAQEMAQIHYGFIFTDTLRAATMAIPSMLRAVFQGRMASVVLYLASTLAASLILVAAPLLLFLMTEEWISVFFYAIIMVQFINLMMMDKYERRYSNNRYYLADDLAVKWTMYPEALVSALRKAAANIPVTTSGFMHKLSFAPFGPDTVKSERLFGAPEELDRSGFLKPFSRSMFADYPKYPDIEKRIHRLEKELGQDFSPPGEDNVS